VKRASLIPLLGLQIGCGEPLTAHPGAGGDTTPRSGSSVAPDAARDARIAAYLQVHRDEWHDFNVPYEDGEELERLVVGCKCKNILEIGTSTGHSTIWLAKAALRTGGHVTTIEIDPGRHQRAVSHFNEAGVSNLIDARLGDAMKVIPTLDGPVDFVFSDATWSTQPANGYTEFFRIVEPKLAVGGLFTMHNVTDGYGDDGRFFRYLEGLGTYETRIVRTSRAGISISRKLR